MPRPSIPAIVAITTAFIIGLGYGADPPSAADCDGEPVTPSGACFAPPTLDESRPVSQGAGAFRGS
jgi:hypothetical protein